MVPGLPSSAPTFSLHSHLALSTARERCLDNLRLAEYPALILSGGGGNSLEVYNSRHETAYVKSGSVSLVFLQI
jgi:hypothetical protein